MHFIGCDIVQSRDQIPFPPPTHTPPWCYQGNGSANYNISGSFPHSQTEQRIWPEPRGPPEIPSGGLQISKCPSVAKLGATRSMAAAGSPDAVLEADAMTATAHGSDRVPVKGDENHRFHSRNSQSG